MSNENINISISEEHINASATDEIFKISIDGAMAGAGTTDHSQLSNLGYDNSGHTGFQKSLTYDANYKAYEVD